MPASRVESFRGRLEAHRRRLADCAPDPTSPGFIAAIEELLELIRGYDDREAFVAFERSGAVEGYRELFAPRVLEFTASIERRTHAELICIADRRQAAIGPLLEANSWGAYARFAQALESVDLSSCRRSVIVGCGPLPDSLLYLHGETAIETLVGVDRDPTAARMARELMRALAIDRVQIVDGDGLELDYSQFDLICPSVFALPRRGILERIAETANDDAVILLRDPFFTGTLLFEPVIDALPPGLEVRHEAPARTGSFMLRYYVLGRRRG